jgi:hypothetical protein
MRFRARNMDRLKRVFFIERIGNAAAGLRRPVDGFVGEFDGSRLSCRRKILSRGRENTLRGRLR